MKYTKADQQEARDRLTKLLPPGSTLYSIVRSVSRSGMSRQFSFYAIQDNAPVWITYSVAALLGLPMKQSSRDTARVDGCGMDMAFATAYNLAGVLYEDGYAIKSEIL